MYRQTDYLNFVKILLKTINRCVFWPVGFVPPVEFNQSVSLNLKTLILSGPKNGEAYRVY